MLPAIVIPAYNRPQALARLLASLQHADYPAGVSIPLVISIDPEHGTPNREVREVAESFLWDYGPKEVVLHKEHLGMLQNFYYCGRLTEKFGAAIFLEDDLFVSPAFFYYATQALDYFKNDRQIAGISLYCNALNGYTHYPFQPLSDATDIYFMQIGSILGQVWSRTHWAEFEAWQKQQTNASVIEENALHRVWSQFDPDDYFANLTRYLVSTDRYYVFPRVSLTTGFGDAGTHFQNSTSYFQVPLQGGQVSFRFGDLETSTAIYDSFMELLPQCIKRLAPALRDIEFDVDLHATKEPTHLLKDFVLTTRACNETVKTFALAMQPPEANLVYNAQGTGINLCRPSDLRWGRWDNFRTYKKLYDYHSHGQRMSLKQSLAFYLFGLIERWLT